MQRKVAARVARLMAALIGLLMASAAALAEGEIDYQARLEALIAETGAPGAGLVLRVDGEIVVEVQAGERAIGTGVRVEAGDVWHVGSITKSMTATLVARLTEAGRIDGSLSIGEALGPHLSDLHPAYADVSFSDLLAHRAGLKRNIPIWRLMSYDRDGEADVRAERLDYARRALSAAPRIAPGTATDYSNSGYVVVGAMLEATLDESWESLMATHVFTPLGLATAGFGPAGTMGEVDAPRGHRGTFFGGRRAMAPDGRADNPPVLGPAGRVHMSLRDLTAYGQAHITGQAGDGTTFLSQESLARLHTPPNGGDYAAGWVVSPPARFPSRLWHNGSNTLNYAELYVDPPTAAVLAVAVNDHDVAGNAEAMRDLAQDVFEQLATD